MEKVINVDKLIFSYEENQQILNNLTFSINKGEIFGFLGPNGSGKSTTQKILMGMLREYSGKVQVFNKEIKEWNQEIYRQISVLFEYPYLYLHLNAYDNLEYFSSFYPKENRQEIDYILDRVELKNDFRNKVVGSYSKGMKQRLSLARALISSPEILFLDEPTSGLDPNGAVLFRKIIEEEKKKGTTIFLTTHNMHDAELLCDRIAFIVEGEIKAIDNPISYKEKHAKNEVKMKYRLNNGQVIEETSDKEDFLSRLSSIGVEIGEIISIHSNEANLGDVFIALTGKELVKNE